MDTYEMFDVRSHNIKMMKRPPAQPRVLGPWNSANVHENNCRCERCGHLNVNSYALKERPDGER